MGNVDPCDVIVGNENLFVDQIESIIVARIDRKCIAVIVGDDEAVRQVAAIKSLRSNQAAQREVTFDGLAAELGQELQASPA